MPAIPFLNSFMDLPSALANSGSFLAPNSTTTMIAPRPRRMAHGAVIRVTTEQPREPEAQVAEGDGAQASAGPDGQREHHQPHRSAVEQVVRTRADRRRESDGARRGPRHTEPHDPRKRRPSTSRNRSTSPQSVPSK